VPAYRRDHLPICIADWSRVRRDYSKTQGTVSSVSKEFYACRDPRRRCAAVTASHWTSVEKSSGQPQQSGQKMKIRTRAGDGEFGSEILSRQ